mmetsp:Transcript_20506/g.22277  ORF Transcript_20506/g.22277 Transcript_20506/m.22277 type:complete len:545 (+) Transcript_20506:198-1832(+)|eukprot:CAMPEP_0173144584 /NCGR_PEP_ID=MMETSP1105-20130129/7311_1 /TAXON_ID=2985 /ORGANISM="Ochromonas sp., Strain BG-1" /LENGTH=544 /DNA_ID=CAMNT_0014058275 /DNA_START=98 /DNA_END=1732 /DNA_ORIENTATION=-
MATILDEFGIEALKTSGKLQIPKSRKEKLQAELQLLEWHKMANAAAIKGALLQTKSLKQQTRDQPKVAPFQAEEDSKWIKRVIQQEHIKPLEVSKDFVLDYERKEKENADRLANQVDRHIGTLKQLRMKLEARHDLKTRTEEYRTWQRDFLPKKHAVMVGKTLAEFEATSQSPTTKQEIDEINDELINKTLNKANNATQSQELSNVLESLSKLADLEKRISSLEKENKYDQLVAMESPSANQRTQFEFRKKRDVVQNIHQDNSVMPAAARGGGGGPMGMVYEVRTKKQQQQGASSKWKVNLPSGAGAQVAKAKRNNQYDTDEYETEYDNDGDDNVFITAQRSEASILRERQKRERMRQKELAPAGVKSLKSRITARKGRQKEQVIGARKHDEAMKEMARRKADQLSKKLNNGNSRQPANARRVTAPTKGIAAGIKTKNKHLQEFHQMKSGFSKRKDEITRKAPVRGGVEDRLQSQTVPVYASKLTKPVPRQPATKAGGAAITRRTGNALPTRRPGHTQPLSDRDKSSIAVTGISGLRVLRASKK